MEPVLLLGMIIVVVMILIAVFLARLIKNNSQIKNPHEGMMLLQNQINELSRMVDAKMSEAAHATRWQFGESTKIIKEITEKLTRLDETNKQVVGFADQLKNLQDILKNPKQRGILGEYYLESVLKNVLPPGGYQMQYPFKDGTIVDAVVFTKDGIVPIDSKFSLENYNRVLDARTRNDKESAEHYESAFANDLKIRIDETAKYVKPEEGTLEFAFMFIPSEAVYYDLLINQVGAIKSNMENLLEYAFSRKKVMVVSPTTFLAYLQTVLQGLRALRVEESAKEIKKRVYELGKHLASYDGYMQKLGNHLGTSVSAYNSAYKELGKIDKDILRISEKNAGLEPLTLERPQTEE